MSSKKRKIEKNERLLEREHRKSRWIGALEESAPALVSASRASLERGCFLLSTTPIENRGTVLPDYNAGALRELNARKFWQSKEGKEAQKQPLPPYTVIEDYNLRAATENAYRIKLNLDTDVRWMAAQDVTKFHSRWLPAMSVYDTRYECLVLFDPADELGEAVFVGQTVAYYRADDQIVSFDFEIEFQNRSHADLWKLVALGEQSYRGLSWRSSDEVAIELCSVYTERTGSSLPWYAPDGSYRPAGPCLDNLAGAAGEVY